MTEEKNQNAIKKVIEKYSKEAGISIHQLRGYLTDPRFIGILHIYKQEILAHIKEEVEKLDLSGVYVYFNKNSTNETNKELLEKRIRKEVLAILDEVGK